MAKNYYSLVAGLPDILLGDRKKQYSSVELREQLQDELTNSDYAIAEALYLPYDHTNFLNKKYGANADFDSRGLFLEEEIEKLLSKRSIDILDEQDFPLYLIELAAELEAHEDINRTEAEVKLTQAYYNYMLNFNNEFITEYMSFERNLKNVFIALNGRKYDMDVYSEFIIGDGTIVDALRKSRARDFGLAGEVDHIEDMLKLFDEENLQERGFKIDQLKWDYIDEITFFNYFTIEKVLGFIFKLFFVERWMELSAEEGRKLFEQLLEDLDSKYEFPEEFSK